ncbi:hypothetical protein AKJ50_00690 [candidate division MSBL1 archaeon SCGC-AAA382A13]|uniref:Peptidase M28 domain-containing protein n=2 Tax=candidate division MSBL1 TaxID=215777 RepID=A0A133VG94_9EURY|nr:hypothetical protein AKJ49_00740 [candidate division MSBL1 archaeon SCGC-AAA382A03]KXB05522.1 hypothetical protein AKJ50_00690 [candidate division MSBL1 archaeon SCGC-AAA382A13]
MDDEKESFESRRSFEHIDKLAYEIGPREAGSERSGQAAEYIKKQFEGYDLETEFQNFEFIGKVIKARLKAGILLIAFILAFLVNFYFGSLIALIIGGAGIGLAFILPKALPKEKDRNVIGTLKPKEKIKKRIIVGAHYDSARCVRGRIWTILFRMLQPLILTIFVVFLIGLFLSRNSSLLGWLIIAVFYFFTFSIPLWIFERLVSPGADDNASGVSVMLEVARVLSESPLENVEVKFVAFGAEEQGLIGSDYFSKNSNASDFLFNIDTVGSGDELSIVEGNGVIRKHRTSSELKNRISKNEKISVYWAPFSGYDHIPFIKRGMKAVTLSSFENIEKNTLDHFLEKVFKLTNVQTIRHSQLHTVEDEPEKIKLENIRRAGEITLNMLGAEDD